MHYGNIKDAKEEASLILKGLNDKSIVQIIDEIFKKNKGRRSEEHTSELQSHSFISYAVFCLKKKKNKHIYIKLTKHQP